MSRARSGLGSITRNWSEASISQAPQSSQEIPWPPTPQQSATTKLSGYEQRMKDIQDALAGHPSNSGNSSLTQPLNPSNALNKRPSLGAAPSEPAPKKARQLPPNWEGKDPLTHSGFGKNAISSFKTNSSGSASANKPPPAVAVNSSAKSKVAPVFLSQEQTQILKLVQEGNSVFYTGSAGELMHTVIYYFILTARRHR